MIALAKPNNLLDFPQPQGKSNEWYTPARYIEAAREVMGGIDLDPASCELANRTVKATRFYTAKENGLAQEWYGRVFCNPPYGKVNNKSLILLFVRKLVSEYESGNIEQAVLLCDCDPDTAWFQLLSNYLICLTDHSVYFYRPSAHGLPQLYSRHGHMYGSIFVYLGKDEQKFIDIFSQFGPVYKRVSTPRQTVTPLSLWEVS